MMLRDRQIRVAIELDEEVKKIARKRIANGKDKKMRSTRRLTLAIVRHQLFPRIEADIIKADLDSGGIK